ncbi:MAG: hypothetical protein HKL99_16820 [Burkholderiales bacterium]|nr:hypothetical protein [Burkholderiales bacterium]
MSKKKPQAFEVVDMDNAPTPLGRPPIKLDTVQGCLDELAAVYRAAKHGRMDVNRATKLGYLLQILIRGHETASLEARIAALELPHEPKP